MTTTTNERDFNVERLTARVAELRQLHKDDETFKTEVTKVLLATARTEAERKQWQDFLKMFKALR